MCTMTWVWLLKTHTSLNSHTQIRSNLTSPKTNFKMRTSVHQYAFATLLRLRTLSTYICYLYTYTHGGTHYVITTVWIEMCFTYPCHVQLFERWTLHHKVKIIKQKRMAWDEDITLMKTLHIYTHTHKIDTRYSPL